MNLSVGVLITADSREVRKTNVQRIKRSTRKKRMRQPCSKMDESCQKCSTLYLHDDEPIDCPEFVEDGLEDRIMHMTVCMPIEVVAQMTD